MGKFDGVLLISDFDDTLLRTSASVRSGQDLPEIPAYNIRRIRDFMDQGGRFAVVTGRVWQSFRYFLPMVPTNAPVGTGNGAAMSSSSVAEEKNTSYAPYQGWAAMNCRRSSSSAGSPSKRTFSSGRRVSAKEAISR